jgi:multiple sugar transport system permease protein
VSTARGKPIQGWLLSSPYLIHTIAFFILPGLWSLALIFSQWNLISPQRQFVGLANLREALTSPRVWNALFVSYRFMLIILPTVLFGSLILALITNAIPYGKSLFAVGFFLPYLSSGVAISVVVRGLISFNSPINVFLRRITGSSPNWLGDPNLAIVVISGMIAWKLSGYYALIVLAGLQSIPRQVYEAAAIDGASTWRQFWSITIPMLYPSLYTVLILAVGIMFSIFTEPYTLTSGGPQGATFTWQLEIFYQAFERFRAGYGATVALLNAVTTFVTILIIRRLVETQGRRWGYGLE